MKKEIISDYQSILIIVMFITSAASLYAPGIEAKQDFWLAITLSTGCALIMGLIFAHLHSIFPGKNLFDIIHICFGKFFGNFVILLFIWFCFEEGTEVLIAWYQFVSISLDKTPNIVIIIFTMILCTWVVKEGIEILARVSTYFFLTFIVLVTLSTLSLIPNMNFNNFLPVLSNGINPVLKGGFTSFAFPFGEILAFSMFFSDFKSQKSPRKIYITGILIAGILTLLISSTNVLVLGANDTSTNYHPSLIANKRISIDFLQRVEIIVAIAFAFGRFIKISVYLIAACKGISKITGNKDYRFIIVPISLLMICLSLFYFESPMTFMEFYNEVWIYRAIPYEVILPIIIFIFAKVKTRLQTKI